MGVIEAYLAAIEQKLYAESEYIMDMQIKPDPELSYRLLKMSFEGKCPAYFPRDLVDYVPLERLIEIFASCLSALGLDYKKAEQLGLSRQHEALEALVFQMPQLFHPHLDLLWRTSKTEMTEAWCSSGTAHHSELVNCLNDPEQKEYHYEALCRLELSNCTEGFDLARQLGPPQLITIRGEDGFWMQAPKPKGTHLLEWAGVEYRNGEWVKLYFDTSYHMRFPDEKIDEHNESPQENIKLVHPTWKLDNATTKIEFGGAGVSECAICGQESHRLFALKENIEDIALTAPVIFETCLYCMTGHRPMDAQHDHLGIPSISPSYQMFDRSYEPEALPAMVVGLAPTPKRWSRQGESSGQNISRIGGLPVWIQGPDYPTCDNCENRMMYLAQIGDGFMYVNAIIQIFWCEVCRISAVLNTYT